MSRNRETGLLVCEDAVVVERDRPEMGEGAWAPLASVVCLLCTEASSSLDNAGLVAYGGRREILKSTTQVLSLRFLNLRISLFFIE